MLLTIMMSIGADFVNMALQLLSWKVYKKIVHKFHYSYNYYSEIISLVSEHIVFLTLTFTYLLKL